jgi:hypothetical protein
MPVSLCALFMVVFLEGNKFVSLKMVRIRVFVFVFVFVSVFVIIESCCDASLSMCSVYGGVLRGEQIHLVENGTYSCFRFRFRFRYNQVVL